jgi:hypothetical protein
VPSDGSTFTVGLTDRVNFRHAPIPANDSEAILFRLLYETLVEVDCEGKARPGLARSWEIGERETWTFLPRESFRFHGEVRLAGRLGRGDLGEREPVREEEDPRPEPGRWPRKAMRITLTEGGAGSLHVHPYSSRDDILYLLDHPTLSFGHRGVFRMGPERIGLGTLGEFSGDGDRTGAWTLRWSPAKGVAAPAPEEIHFRVLPGTDPRDLAGADVDLIPLRDREAIDFFARTTDFVLTPMPFTPIYFLITRDENLSALADDAMIEDLARRVVRAEGRPAETISAIRVSGRDGDPGAPGGEPGRRILYPEPDRDARVIAERFAALTPGGSGPVVTGLRHRAFHSSLHAGSDAAYVLPVRLRNPRQTILREEILSAAPWIVGRGGTAIPLVETRAVLATRPGLVGIDCGYDAVPRLEHAGWEPRWRWP